MNVLRGASVLALTVVLAGCGGGGTPARHATSTPARRPGAARSTPSPGATTTGSPTGSTSTPAATTTTPAPPPAPPTYARLTTAALSTGPTGFVPAATYRGHAVAWVERTAAGIAVLSFSSQYLELHLHSGTLDAGSVGWRFGPSVAGSEASRLLAAFNGGFKLSVGAGGFQSYGRVAAPLRNGLGSIVTYSDGTTDVGSWGTEVPTRGKTVVSVRQNLSLLIDNGVPAANQDCLICWGATLGGVSDPARAALGIDANGNLVWAAGEHVTVSALSSALVAAHVERAVELDINPEWVAGYLYGHRGGHGPLAPVPVLDAQTGIPGEFLQPWSRDFFTVVTRPGV